MRKLKPRIVRSFSKVCLALQTAHNPQTGHCEEMLSGRVLGTGSVYTEHSLLFTFEGCLFGSSSLSECFCVEFSMVRHEQIFQRSAKRTSPSMIQGQGNKMIISSVQLLSRVWLCDPMDCSTPGFPVHHQLLELAQTPIYQVGDAILSSHPLSSPSPPAFNLSQHQGLFQ